jgi:hypothetical protein
VACGPAFWLQPDTAINAPARHSDASFTVTVISSCSRVICVTLYTGGHTRVALFRLPELGLVSLSVTQRRRHVHDYRDHSMKR